MYLLFMVYFIKFLIDNLNHDLQCIDFDFEVSIFKVIFSSLIFSVEIVKHHLHKKEKFQARISVIQI